MFFDCYCPRRDRTASARARQVEFRGLKPLRCRCVHQGRSPMHGRPIRPIATRAATLTVALFAAAAAAAAAAEPASFFTALDAYGNNDYAACGATLSDLYTHGIPFPDGGELLLIECTAAAGDHAAAFAYVDALLASGRLPLEDLRTKQRPGLNALRADPAWPAVLQRVIAEEKKYEALRDAPLRQALLAREAKDQTAQHAAIAAGGGDAWRQTAPVSEANATWLKAVIAEKGWPGTTRVGRDGAKAAWLIVQHADHDPAFQAQALALMQTAAETGDADAADVALLTDRVLIAQGKPQRYGTQFKSAADGVMELQPTEDMQTLDARRRAVGLQPLEAYKAMLSDSYGKPVR
ncbi:DUF6624 domain-containing protein [Stenotrophomonas bentonitica]|uniref:DUF6624 domain-containing protein n=1 Tax=Stenotrophomonas bentonitica TaxID=1450134 RepID=UPI0036E6EAEB